MSIFSFHTCCKTHFTGICLVSRFTVTCYPHPALLTWFLLARVFARVGRSRSRRCSIPLRASGASHDAKFDGSQFGARAVPILNDVIHGP